MFNVQGLTKMLAGKDLAYIQSYANAHKNDPLVVATALHVANMKKEMQTAQQGQAGQQPMPSVVDQDIAAIAPAPAMDAAQLPENVGIGQLPAQNIQGMAGGGIVAFEEGGHVPRFNGTEGSVPMSYGEQMSNLAEFFNPVTRFRQLVSDPSLRKPTAPIFEIPESTLKGSGDTTAVDQLATDMAAQQAASTKADTKAAPKVDAGLTGLGLGLGTAASTGGAGGGAGAGLGGFMDYLKSNRPVGPESMDDYMKRREAYLGDNPTKKQMERLDKQEAQALADKEEAKAMALIKAGLTMFGGTSQFANENIGKGGTAGLEDYATSQKDAKKLKLERDKMRDAIENAAFAYKKGDMDAYEKYATDAANRQATYAAHGLSALGSVTGHQISAAATRDAAASHANALPANMRMAMALGTGDTAQQRLESGFAKMNALSAEKTDLTFAKMYAEHVNNAQKLMQQPMSPVDFAKTIRSGLAAYKPTVVDTDNPAGTMYARPS